MNDFIPKPLKRFAWCLGVVTCIGLFLPGCANLGGGNGHRVSELSGKVGKVTEEMQAISKLVKDLSRVADDNADLMGKNSDKVKELAAKTGAVADKAEKLTGEIKDAAKRIEETEGNVGNLIQEGGKVAGYILPGQTGALVETGAMILGALFGAKKVKEQVDRRYSNDVVRGEMNGHSA